ncbi:unnamed protein product [Ectocarpus fasciculatus]
MRLFQQAEDTAAVEGATAALKKFSASSTIGDTIFEDEETNSGVESSKAPEEISIEEDTTAPRPPFHHMWLRSRGDDTNPGARMAAGGTPLAMHSVSTRTAHLPPDDDLGHDVSCQRWRDRYGQVEVAVAPQNAKHMENVRLLDNVYMKELSHREESGTCLIDPVIRGPSGVAFAPGTASVRYFVSTYDLLVQTNGDKGGRTGMQRYIGETYFPVVKGDGPNDRWEADGDFAVIWKGEELWLETELRHFSSLGLAFKKAWGRLFGRPDDALPSGPLSLKPLRVPFGSTPIPKGYIRVSNYSDVCVRAVLAAEMTTTSDATTRNVAGNMSGGVPGVNASIGANVENSRSRTFQVRGGVRSAGTWCWLPPLLVLHRTYTLSDFPRTLFAAPHLQPTSVFGTPSGSQVKANTSDFHRLPGDSQSARFLWCTVSRAFAPEDLPMDEIGPEPVSTRVLARHGYWTVGENASEACFEEKAGGARHETLFVVRVWDNVAIAAGDMKMISQEIFSEDCLWDASVPSKDDVETRLHAYLNRHSRAPST